LLNLFSQSLSLSLNLLSQSLSLFSR